MKDTLKEGFTFEFKYTVPDNKTVPTIYPESPEFQEMPEVFATGYMVGLFEWACVQALKPYLDWPQEQTVGIQVNFSHTAATPPGLTITVKGTLTKIDGRKLSFAITADDGVDQISEGTHDRFIILSEKFNKRVREKLKSSDTK
jgi:fluoroacetyl-CoA thioesterase